MKQFSYSLLKLEYDKHGRLYLKAFKNIRTNNIDYFIKKQREFISTVNKETQILGIYNMNKDILTYYNNEGVYEFLITPALKHFIRSIRGCFYG